VRIFGTFARNVLNRKALSLSG